MLRYNKVSMHKLSGEYQAWWRSGYNDEIIGYADKSFWKILSFSFISKNRSNQRVRWVPDSLRNPYMQTFLDTW